MPTGSDLFNEANQDDDNPNDSNVFNPSDNRVDPDKDYLSELVGDGKKYRDERALARAVAEKELFIERLKNELNGVREDLKTRETSQALIDQLKDEVKRMKDSSNSPQSNRSEPPAPNAENDALKTLTPEDVERLVEERFEARKSVETRRANMDRVQREMTEKFDNPQQVIKNTADQLGVGLEFLKDLAQDRPSVFMKLIDDNKRKGPEGDDFFSTPRTRIDVNRVNTGRASTDNKDWEYYKKLRSENPSLYWSPQVQNEMYRKTERGEL